jgi:hypothetical protein
MIQEIIVYHDWAKYEALYQTSNYDNPGLFLTEVVRLNKSELIQFKNKYQGWLKRKNKIRLIQLERVEEDLVSDPDYQKAKKQALLLKNMALERARMKLENDDMTAGEIKSLWEIAKVEAGEPTSVSKNIGIELDENGMPVKKVIDVVIKRIGL